MSELDLERSKKAEGGRSAALRITKNAKTINFEFSHCGKAAVLI